MDFLMSDTNTAWEKVFSPRTRRSWEHQWLIQLCVTVLVTLRAGGIFYLIAAPIFGLMIGDTLRNTKRQALLGAIADEAFILILNVVIMLLNKGTLVQACLFFIITSLTVLLSGSVGRKDADPKS
jgi:hypothetical protein